MPAETKIRHRDRYYFANLARYDARDLIGCLDPIGLDSGTSRYFVLDRLGSARGIRCDCIRNIGLRNGGFLG